MYYINKKLLLFSFKKNKHRSDQYYNKFFFNNSYNNLFILPYINNF